MVNYEALRAANTELKKLYGSHAYLDADAIPTMTPDMNTRELAVRVTVIEGEQYLFNQVHFELTLVENPAILDNQKVEQDLQSAWLLTEGQLCRYDLVVE